MSKLRVDQFVNSDDNGAPSFPNSATTIQPTESDQFATKLYADTSLGSISPITNTISPIEPSSPSVGDFWTDISNLTLISLSVWDGSDWIKLKSTQENPNTQPPAGSIISPPSISDPNSGYIPTMLTATSAVVSDATLSSSKWYKDDVEIPGAIGLQFYATEIGTYKYEEIWVDELGTQLFPSLSAVIDARAGVIDAQPTITSSNGVYSPTTLTATAAVVSNATLVGSKWYRDGVEIAGETGLSINIPESEGGIYKYEETWTDAFGTQLLPTLSASVQVFATIADPTVLTPADGTGSIDFNYTAESSAITDISTIDVLGAEAFSTTLYTGNGNGAWNGGNNTVPSGLDFTEGDWLSWIKVRNAVDSHFMSDSTQKTGTMYDSFASDRQYGKQTGESTGISAVGVDGYTIDGQNNQVNGTNKDYVAWNFRVAPGFFDIVNYSGNSIGGRSISHNLGSTPGMIMIKAITDSGQGDWIVWHKDAGQYEAKLNSYHAFQWGVITSASDTEFTLDNGGPETNLTGHDYIAYIFADNPDNQIKCGSYVGAGYGGKLVTLGFKPHWLLIKKSTGISDWAIVDSTRGNFNELYANSSVDEDTGKF